MASIFLVYLKKYFRLSTGERNTLRIFFCTTETNIGKNFYSSNKSYCFALFYISDCLGNTSSSTFLFYHNFLSSTTTTTYFFSSSLTDLDKFRDNHPRREMKKRLIVGDLKNPCGLGQFILRSKTRIVKKYIKPLRNLKTATQDFPI